jgi:hypothetical protein
VNRFLLTGWCLLLAVSITVHGQWKEQRAVSIEQSIAGITIGEKVADARRAYPNLAGPKGGVWSVPIGRNCRLELVLANERADVEAPIEVVTLERVSSSDTDKDEACDDVATGAGLKFGDTLETIQCVYKGIALMEPGKEPSLYRADNGRECLSRRSALLRSMFIYWSNQNHRIVMISIDASTLACREYRDTIRQKK